MNNDITECINQLAERAEELGEKSTACVLYTLAAHRIVKADAALALVVVTQAAILHNVLKEKMEENHEA